MSFFCLATRRINGDTLMLNHYCRKVFVITCRRAAVSTRMLLIAATVTAAKRPIDKSTGVNQSYFLGTRAWIKLYDSSERPDQQSGFPGV